MSGGLERDASSAEVMDGLVQVSFAVIALLSQVAAANDLSLTQLRTLAILRDREPRMADLAAHLGLDRSSASGLIDRAVARGLVRKDASRDDGRAVRISLTADGRRLTSRLSHDVGDRLAPMTGALGPRDQERLRVLLDRLLAR